MEINVLWVIGYFILYAVMTGCWNMVLTGLTSSKSSSLSERSFDDAWDAEIRYTTALSKCWLIKISKNLAFLPLYNVLAMLLWPVYLMVLIPTGLYYLFKYYKPSDSIEEEEVA